MLATHDSEIRDRLLELRAKIPPGELIMALEPAAARFVAEDPFAFILATSLDRGTKAEIIWTIPYWMRRDLGHLDPALIREMTTDDLAAAVSRLPKKPRYAGAAPLTILSVARLVAGEFGGDAERIWAGRTAREVQHTLMRIHGVGPGIAAMAVILLERTRGVQWPDWNVIDVKPDVHVQRVLFRLGIAPELSAAAALGAAVRLNPVYPGLIDSPLWIIGRQWCRESAPKCRECWMGAKCRKAGL